MGYFLLAIPAALMMKRASYKAGFVLGLLLLPRLFLVLAGRAAQQLRFLPFRALCHCQRAFLFGDGFQSLYLPNSAIRTVRSAVLNFSQGLILLGAITAALVGTCSSFPVSS